jgi:hypothetical protein
MTGPPVARLAGKVDGSGAPLEIEYPAPLAVGGTAIQTTPLIIFHW